MCEVLRAVDGDQIQYNMDMTYFMDRGLATQINSIVDYILPNYVTHVKLTQ